MPSSLTKVGVWNLAIDIIRDTALQTTSDPAPTARWLDRNWAQTVETTLRAYPWNFAKQLVSLSADATGPEHSWTYSYKPPAGWLRILPITRYGERFGATVPFEIVGDRIYTNEPAPLRVRLIMDKSSNPGSWDPLFTEIVRCKLALGMANKFTSKARYVSLAEKMLDKATAQAEMIDAFEGTPEPVEQFEILRVRGSTSTNTGWR
jgi:hypothetical protein